MRRPSVVQILLLIVLGTLLAVLWRGRAPQKPAPRWERAEPRIPVDRVTDLELERPRTGERIQVRWEGDTAWIVVPYRDRADPRFVAQSIRAASDLEPLRALPDTTGAAFGLTPPLAVWNCRWERGSYRIALGDTLPAGGGTFARLYGGPEVLVIDAFLARRYLAPPFTDLHDPMPARLEIGPLDSVHVVTREERIVIVRRGEESWRIRRPLEVDASSLALARAIETLRRESLTAFLGSASEIDRAGLGLDPPRATWTLFQSGRGASVRIGHPSSDEKSVYMIPAGRDVVAEVASEHFRLWVDGVARLRDPLILDVPPDSVVAVRVEGGGMQRLFVRGPDGGFREETPAGARREIDSVGFDRSLRNLCATQALGFERGTSDFRADLLLILELAMGESDTLQIGTPSGETGLLRIRRQPGLCLIPSGVARTWEAWLHRPPRGSSSSPASP